MKKMDNYVALYGFLRSITFISDCATLWITVKYLIPTINISANLNFHLILIWLSCILVTNIFFMAFIKFYRRFTLESFMCLVIDTSFKIVDKAPYHFNYTQPTTLESSIKTVSLPTKTSSSAIKSNTISKNLKNFHDRKNQKIAHR